jgi:hypothetical protein
MQCSAIEHAQVVREHELTLRYAYRSSSLDISNRWHRVSMLYKEHVSLQVTFM